MSDLPSNRIMPGSAPHDPWESMGAAVWLVACAAVTVGLILAWRAGMLNLPGM